MAWVAWRSWVSAAVISSNQAPRSEPSPSAGAVLYGDVATPILVRGRSSPHSRPATPHQLGQIGGGTLRAENPRGFWPLLATPGRGQTISGAAAMAVPSSIGTGTPAPAIRLPLDPAPTHPRERPFRRNRACDLIFKRDRQRCGDGASPKRPVCHSHSPHPQLPT